MMGPDTALVTAVNGVPYWYFYGLDGPWRDRRVNAVDPDGTLWDILPPSQAIGCVVYPAAEVIEPGVIAHSYGDRFSLGEPDGSRSPRIEALSKLLIGAGLKAPVRPRIRDEIWVKLWGNLAFNPLSVLTLSTLDRLTGEPDLRALCKTMMLEAKAVAEALGIALRDRRGSPHRRRRRGGRAQDLDAAGPRTRPADGDRRAPRRGSRTGRRRRPRDADVPRDPGVGARTGAKGGVLLNGVQ